MQCNGRASAIISSADSVAALLLERQGSKSDMEIRSNPRWETMENSRSKA